MCVTLVVAGVIIYGLEFKVNKDDFNEEGGHVKGVAKGVYLAFMGFFSGGTVNTPHKTPTKVLTMGLAFFILIATASYTANLAALMVDARVGAINDVRDVVARGLKVCVPDGIDTFVQAPQPTSF